MRTGHGFVDDSESPSAFDEAIGLFLNAGWSAEDAAWLVGVCFEHMPGLDTDAAVLSPFAQIALDVVARALEETKDIESEHAPFAEAFARAIGCGGKGAGLPSSSEVGRAIPAVEACVAMARQFRAHGVDFAAAIASGWWPGPYPNWSDPNMLFAASFRRGKDDEFERHPQVRLMRVLFAGADIDLARVCGTESLVGLGLWWSDPDPALGALDRAGMGAHDASDPTDALNWMVALGLLALPRPRPEFLTTPDNALVSALAGGVRHLIERWLHLGAGHYTYMREGGRELARFAQPWLDALEARVHAGEASDSPALRRLWLWFAWCVFEADETLWESSDVDRQRRILAAANEGLAKVRPLLADATLKPNAEHAKQLVAAARAGKIESPAWLEFEHAQEHLQSCVHLLFQLGGVWKGMKPLLLALRAMACPCVSNDLRYWYEARDKTDPTRNDAMAQPPEPWAWVPRAMVNMFHMRVGREQEGDGSLEGIRGEFATFLLERLDDRWTPAEREAAESQERQRTNQDMREPSPIWRYGCVRAFMALHINPKGRGDRVLKRVSQIDPDEDVRATAHDARQRLRRSTALPENMSPRRAVLGAAWWLRQAHFIEMQAKYNTLPASPDTVRIELDRDGARRTRAKELDRTQEPNTDTI